MLSHEIDRYRHALIDLLRRVGKELTQRQGLHTVDYKDGDFKDLVSDADLWVQDVLNKGLAYLLPEASFVSEEKENPLIQGLTWIVDPIDGTANYVQYRRDYAISVALYDGEKPLLGAVYDVDRQDLYSAGKGCGAWCNENRLPRLEDRPLSACFLDMSLGTMRMLDQYSRRPLMGVQKEVRAHRALGCASLAMARIAAGEWQIYLSSKLRPWDYAAARLLLEEVGGVVRPIFQSDQLLQFSATAILACDRPERAEQLLHQYFA